MTPVLTDSFLLSVCAVPASQVSVLILLDVRKIEAWERVGDIRLHGRIDAPIEGQRFLVPILPRDVSIPCRDTAEIRIMNSPEHEDAGHALKEPCQARRHVRIASKKHPNDKSLIKGKWYS